MPPRARLHPHADGAGHRRRPGARRTGPGDRHLSRVRCCPTSSQRTITPAGDRSSCWPWPTSSGCWPTSTYAAQRPDRRRPRHRRRRSPSTARPTATRRTPSDLDDPRPIRPAQRWPSSSPPCPTCRRTVGADAARARGSRSQPSQYLIQASRSTRPTLSTRHRADDRATGRPTRRCAWPTPATCAEVPAAEFAARCSPTPTTLTFFTDAGVTYSGRRRCSSCPAAAC